MRVSARVVVSPSWLAKQAAAGAAAAVEEPEQLSRNLSAEKCRRESDR